MAKTRKIARHEPNPKEEKNPWPELTVLEMEARTFEFFKWTASRTRSEVSWWQSLREFSNMKFNEAYDRATKG